MIGVPSVFLSPICTTFRCSFVKNTIRSGGVLFCFSGDLLKTAGKGRFLTSGSGGSIMMMEKCAPSVGV